jgi:P22 coat protein - gene protein 5.
MANVITTLKAGDITRKSLSILHNKLVFIKSINREYDSKFAVSGAKNGGYLEIRKPNQFMVRTGAVMDTQDVVEETTQLVLATQKGVDINFSSAELTLSLDDFADRILEPAMSRLAADVEATVIAAVYPEVYNFENTTFGTKPDLDDLLACRAKLQQGLAPLNDRSCMVDALAANAIIADGQPLFHASSEIERQYSEGLLGRISGLGMMESEMTPTHTNGSRTGSPITDLNFIENGTASIMLTVAGNSKTFKVGDVFTVEGVYAVNPETKEAYPHLQQFVVTADAVSVEGVVTLGISPTIYKTGVKQNVYSAGWTNTTAAVVVELVGSSGTASLGFTNSLVYQKNAFTFVTADLEMPKGVDFAAREVYDGISLRVVRQFDIVNDKYPCRIDVLFGQKAIRPEWATRMCS